MVIEMAMPAEAVWGAAASARASAVMAITGRGLKENGIYVDVPSSFLTVEDAREFTRARFGFIKEAHVGLCADRATVTRVSMPAVYLYALGQAKKLIVYDSDGSEHYFRSIYHHEMSAVSSDDSHAS